MRDSYHRDALKGLSSVRVRVAVHPEGGGARFLPVTRTRLHERVATVLSQTGIEIGNGDRSPCLNVNVRIRSMIEGAAAAMMGVARVETVLQEPVTIQRSGLQIDIDTWRHRSVSGLFPGNTSLDELAKMIEAEVVRQAETFAADCALTTPKNGVKPPEEPSMPPGVICSTVTLGSIDGVPEVKTQMESQCVTILGQRVCTDVPVLYTRTSKVVAMAQICGPAELMGQAIQDLVGCAQKAATEVTLAAILAGPEAALPRFLQSFQPCLNGKLGDKAAQISVSLKVNQEAGEWKRQT